MQNDISRTPVGGAVVPHKPAAAFLGVSVLDGQDGLRADVAAVIRQLLGEEALAAEAAIDFRVGVCDALLNVLSCITLHGHNRIRRMQQDLEQLGYQTVFFGTSEQLRGCDLLFVPDPSSSH